MKKILFACLAIIAFTFASCNVKTNEEVKDNVNDTTEVVVDTTYSDTLQ